MEINLEEYTSTKPFLKNCEPIIRILTAEKKSSAKGNEMYAMEFELVSPEMLETVDGKQVKTNGLKGKENIVFLDFGFARLKDLHKLLGLPLKINTSTDDSAKYIGKAFKVALVTKPFAIKDQTTGEPVLDSETNQPVVVAQYNIQRYIKAAPEYNIVAVY